MRDENDVFQKTLEKGCVQDVISQQQSEALKNIYSDINKDDKFIDKEQEQIRTSKLDTALEGEVSYSL